MHLARPLGFPHFAHMFIPSSPRLSESASFEACERGTPPQPRSIAKPPAAPRPLQSGTLPWHERGEPRDRYCRPTPSLQKPPQGVSIDSL